MGGKTGIETANELQRNGCLTMEVCGELERGYDKTISTSKNGGVQQIETSDISDVGSICKTKEDTIGRRIQEIMLFLFLGKGTSVYSNNGYVKGENWDDMRSYRGETYSYNGLTIYHVHGLWFSIKDNGSFEFLGQGLRAKFPECPLGIIGIKRNGEIFLKKISDDNDKVRGPLVSLPGTSMSQLKESNLEFLVVKGGNILRMFLEDIPTSFGEWDTPIKYKQEGTYRFEEFGDIQEVDRDINRNFVLVVGKKGDKYTLYVLRGDEWTKGEVLIKIEGVKNFVVMQDGSILGEMEDGKVRSIVGTFTQFEKGYFDSGGNVVAGEGSVKKVRDTSHEKMVEAIRTISTKGGESSGDPNDLDVSEQDVISEFWSKKVDDDDKTIKELFDEAETQEEIKRVESLAKIILVSISSFEGGIRIKNYIKDIIIKKKEEIVLRDFQKDVNDAEETLDKADNFQDLIDAKTVIMNLHERKKSIPGSPLAIDLGKRIKKMIETVEGKIAEYKEEGKDDILARIQKNVEELKLYIDAISYGADLSQIYNLDIWKETMELLEYLNEEEKKKQKKKLLSLVSQKSSEIVKEEKKESEKKKLEMIRRKNEIDEEIDILIGMLETVHTIESVNEMKETDALAKKIESEIAALPASVRGELEIKYNKAFKTRIFNIRRDNIKEKGIVHNLDESGIDTMLYYVDTEKKDISWKLVGEPTSQGLIKLGLSLDDGKRQYTCDNFFEDSDKFADVIIGDDIEFEITKSEFIKLNKQIEEWKKYGKTELHKLLKKLSEEEDAEKKSKILKEIENLKSQYLKARYIEKLANRLIKKERLNPRSRVPEVNHNYIVLDEEKQSLQVLSGNLLTQKKRSGIAILEGGPGLGKTVMCEYLAAVTNREIIRVQCSKRISYSEFFFAPTLKKGETSRSPAEWIKMMQKPGTIILFDEIDKLNAECLAGLHALFDGGRHVHDPQLGDFYANPDCLFLGTMNSYEPLPKAIASRAIIQRIDYPSEINEAYKISKYVDNDFLNSLNYEEFKEIRRNQGNKKEKTKNSKEHKINEILFNIGKLLQVFRLLRAKYDGEYERFEYELSYRDAAQIFSAYNISHDFKKAVSDILISKASSVVGPGDQKEQRDMVIDVINQVF